MIDRDNLFGENDSRNEAIATARALFKAVEKQARPIVYNETKVEMPKLDFPDHSYTTIHNAYASSIVSMQKRRRGNYQTSSKESEDLMPIELAAKKLARARGGRRK